MGEHLTPNSSAIPANALIHDPLAITHLIVLGTTVFVCYPACYLLDIQGGSRSHSHNKHIFYVTAGVITVSLLSALVGCTLQPEQNQHTPIYDVLRYLLPILVAVHGGLFFLHYGHRDMRCSDPDTVDVTPELTLVLSLVAKCQLLVWAFLAVVCAVYMAYAIIVFTESASGSTLLPLLFGSGFVVYGTFVTLCGLKVISLSPGRSLEYYESVAFIVCGVVCLLIRGTVTRVIPGKYGGLRSINAQTWMPLLQERNVSNALGFALVGRGNIVHTLGSMIILASILNAVHIVFRKSFADKVLPEHPNELNDADEAPLDTHPNPTCCKHSEYCSYFGDFLGIVAASLMTAAGLLWISTAGLWLEKISFYISGPATYVMLVLSFSIGWTVYLFMMAAVYKDLCSSGKIHYERVATSDAHVAFDHQEIASKEDDHGDDDDHLPTHTSMRPSEYRAKRLSLRVHPPYDTVGHHHPAYPRILPDQLDGYVTSSPISNTTHCPDPLHLLSHQADGNRNIDDVQHLDNNNNSSSSSSIEPSLDRSSSPQLDNS
ncbi:hypothetical protein BX666DRAFT_2025721 [Dichotomocladium elegans]|nr:hypothetical protein BX666DRAFT_2025721 [Dichotomocladium elegans]